MVVVNVTKAGRHVCPVVGCAVELPNELLMCRKHWFMVPMPLRHEVNRAYRAWQRGEEGSVRALRVAQIEAAAVVGQLEAER